MLTIIIYCVSITCFGLLPSIAMTFRFRIHTGYHYSPFNLLHASLPIISLKQFSVVFFVNKCNTTQITMTIQTNLNNNSYIVQTAHTHNTQCCTNAHCWWHIPLKENYKKKQYNKMKEIEHFLWLQSFSFTIWRALCRYTTFWLWCGGSGCVTVPVEWCEERMFQCFTSCNSSSRFIDEHLLNKVKQ